MQEIISDIGSTPSLEPVTEENILDLINSAQTQDTQQQQEQQQQKDDLTDGANRPEATPAKPSKVHSCGFCGIVFKSYPALVEHRATHGGSRPYECHVCDKRFTQKAHLIIHRRTHTGRCCMYTQVSAGSPSRGGDVVVYVKDIKQPSLPTPFYSVLVSVSFFMALSTLFYSINSPDSLNSALLVLSTM